MAVKPKKTGSKSNPMTVKPDPVGVMARSSWKILIPVILITFGVFLPALQNGFTNWDDILYVTENSLLKDLSFDGFRQIFSTPVVSNYHPLTILSLAINYQMSELSPAGYHLTSILLHLVNTGLVFWWIMLMSSGNKWVSGITALLFGIHPMHVESVAWVSERKDLLYTLFYLTALIVYMRYLKDRQFKYMIIVTLAGLLSLLSKPAAIVLPLSLLAVDVYMKRTWSYGWLLEKIPLFILSVVFAFVTLDIQSARAVATVEAHGILERICYAGFGWIWYLLKVAVPYPLSALHPFPKDLSLWYYLGTIASLASMLYMVLKVRNRVILFGFGFYTINLLLVLQLVSIGNAVVAERYTYVPYIGIFFWLTMTGYKWMKGSGAKWKWPLIGVMGLWISALILLTVQRIPVWKSSQDLWKDVLSHYPESARAWTNKGLDYYDQKNWPEVIAHLSRALEVEPLHADALEWRGRAFLENKEPQKALQDAELLYRAYPQKEVVIFLLARTKDATGKSNEAVSLYDKLIDSYPSKSEYLNNRGVIYFNKLKNYDAAQSDFEKAIRLAPENGSYYLNLSRCYYMKGDSNSARQYGVRARELGATVDPGYAQLIGMQ